jgi:hypothetical protein
MLRGVVLILVESVNKNTSKVQRTWELVTPNTEASTPPRYWAGDAEGLREAVRTPFEFEETFGRQAAAEAALKEARNRYSLEYCQSDPETLIKGTVIIVKRNDMGEYCSIEQIVAAA